MCAYVCVVDWCGIVVCKRGNQEAIEAVQNRDARGWAGMEAVLPPEVDGFGWKLN